MFHCAGLVGLSLLVQLQTLEVYQHHPVDSGVVQAPEDVEGGAAGNGEAEDICVVRLYNP